LFGWTHEICYTGGMNKNEQCDRQRDELLRKALQTRPISNEEIIRRSKQEPRKRN
jgi:hypothetical protein